MNITKTELILLNSMLSNGIKDYNIELFERYKSKVSHNGQKLYELLKKKNKNVEKWTDSDIKAEGIDRGYVVSVINAEDGYFIKTKEEFEKTLTEFEKEQAKKIAEEMLNLTDVEKLESKIEDLQNVFSSTRKIEKINLAEASKKFFENIDELATKKQVKTRNWLAFNKRVKLYKGDVTIVAGRPGAGKTAFALSLALELAKEGNKGIYFSLEMGEEQIINRLMSQLSMVGIGKFQDASSYKTLQTEEHSKIVKACEHMQTLSKGLQIVSGNFTSGDIYEISKNENIDYIIIDYMQLLQCNQGRGRVEEITYLSMELKRIAMKLQIPVIELCQLSRAIEQRGDKRPMLSDLRESGQLEQDASVVIGLYRDSYYNEDCDDPYKLEVGILKNRHGVCGTLNFDFNGNIQKVNERVGV